MEAQRIITISINKIAGSRNQRGGINLRKNLLVASVLQSARTLYYEEMCNKMSRTTTLYSRCDSEMDDEDCTESPDWGDETDSAPSCEQENNAPAGNAECSTPIATGNEDKENRLPDYITPVVDTLEPVKCERIEQVEDLKSEESSCDESESDRPVLRDLSSQNYSCLTCKRKRSDDDLSCDSYVPVKKAKVDADCCYSHTDNSQETEHHEQGHITSLVSIFKSGFHGLSGDSQRNSNASSEQNSANRSAMSSHLEQSPYVSPIARSLDILSRPIAAC